MAKFARYNSTLSCIDLPGFAGLDDPKSTGSNEMRSRVTRIITIVFALSVSVASAQTEPPGFVQIAPDDIRWSPSPSILSGGRSAVLYGDPRKAAPYITRVKLPGDYRIQPHTHPEERVYTVVTGTFYIGFGEQFDPTALKAFPPARPLSCPPMPVTFTG